MKKKYFLLSLTFFFITFANAQIDQKGIPYLFVHSENFEIPTEIMQQVDRKKLIAEDETNIMLKPYRFAKVFPVNFSTENSGIWIEDEKDNKIWFLKIKSEDAYSINLILENFIIPKGAKLFIYNSEKTHLIGAFTSQNNKKSKILPTAFISGDEIIIEYSEPKNADFHSEFNISSVSHDYRDFYKNDSQWCEVNINCSEGDNWQTVKHSVCKYTYNEGSSTYICTGVLLANTSMDNTPYFLTANHCVNNESAANSMVLYFNYESETCEGTTGSETQTLSGTSLRATADSHLDFSLLELTSLPPENYLPFYAGWNRNSNISSNTTCIHHPAGDIKKISKDDDAPSTGSFPDYDVNKHWKISDWELGTTEGGSSGSPLFDFNQRVIGDLSGGEASCDYNYNDYYQKFEHAWNDYPSAGQNLKTYLDPLNINPTFLDGYDPYLNANLAPPVGLRATISEGTNVDLSWYKPGENVHSIEDGFENYNSFSLNFGTWTQVDKDNGATYGAEDFDFPNEGYTGAFIIFSPAETTPANPTGWEAYSGSKSLACFSAKTNYSPNNDWFISSGITIDEGAELSFVAKSITDYYGLERFKVGISTSGNQTENFTFISSNNYLEAPVEWTEYTYDLSSYEGQDIYICINVVSDDAFCFLLDNFQVTGASGKNIYTENFEINNPSTTKRKIENTTIIADFSKKEHTGYKIYRNLNEISEINDVNITNYTDLDLDDGSYSYYLTALYEDEESRASNIEKLNIGVSVKEIEHNSFINLYPNPNTGIFYIDNLVPENILSTSIFNINGDRIIFFNDSFDKKRTIDISLYPAGVYFVEIVTNGQIINKKIIKF